MLKLSTRTCMAVPWSLCLRRTHWRKLLRKNPSAKKANLLSPSHDVIRKTFLRGLQSAVIAGTLARVHADREMQARTQYLQYELVVHTHMPFFKPKAVVHNENDIWEKASRPEFEWRGEWTGSTCTGTETFWWVANDWATFKISRFQVCRTPQRKPPTPKSYHGRENCLD